VVLYPITHRDLSIFEEIKMNRKFCYFTLVLTLVLTLGVTGCRAPASEEAAPAEEAAQGEPVELTIWQVPNHPDMEQVILDLVKPYEEEHNVKVEVVIIPWDSIDQMWTSAVQSGETPAFGYTYDSRLPDWYRMGALEPLDDYVDQAFLDSILKEPLESAYYQGHLYALPVLLTSDALYYNKKILEDSGVELPDDPLYSPTWEEFLGWLYKIADAGYYGWDNQGFQGVYDHIYDDFYMRFGCTVINDDRTAFAFDQPGCLKAAEAWAELGTTPSLLPPKAVTTGWNRSEAFLEGKAGFCDYWVGLAQRLEKDYPEVEWGVMRPFHADTAKNYLGIGYYAVFADAENKDMAIDLALWLSQPDKQTEWNKTIGLFPAVAVEGLFADASPGVASVGRVVEHNLSSGDAKFVFPWKGNVIWGNEVFNPNREALMLGRITPEEFVKKAREGGQKIWKEYNE
jgi:multiple sugar transport system substrate-binding protein